MKIAFGADWVGFEHKKALIGFIRQLGHEVIDMGGSSSENNDYPDFAEKVGLAVAAHEVDFGILICGTGIGMSIAANKIPGVRAALCHDAFTAGRSRGHNNANVLVMGAQVVSIPHAEELVALWLTTGYDGGRHEPRLVKLASLEERTKSSESYDRTLNPLC
jgi:ribose 5-phosphate isomerase B